MTPFAVGVASLLGLAWWMLRAAWARPVADLAESAEASASIEILGQRLAALDRDQAEGRIDAERHREARTELQRRLLDDADRPGSAATGSGTRSVKWLATAGVPLLAIVLYGAIGNPSALEAGATGTASMSNDADVSPEALQALLASLEQRLQKSAGKTAEDAMGWTMLGRSYAALQRFRDADRALARAIEISPDDAQLLADRADVLAVVQGEKTSGEPERLIDRALRIEPRNLKALSLAGTAAFARNDAVAARGFWQRALAIAPAGSEFATGLERSLAEVSRPPGGGSPADGSKSALSTVDTPVTVEPRRSPSTAQDVDPPASADPARISGRLSLAPALAGRTRPTDTVFVFARAADGPRMPLAILRRTVADLPIEFTLDDSLAMSPQMKLSSFSKVVVGARISRSGDAMPQPGDLRVETTALPVRAGGVQLVIDADRP